MTLSRADAQGGANLFERGDFPPARGGADDGLDLAGRFVEAESRADNVIGRHDAFQRRLDDLLWRRGDDVKREFVAVGKFFERAREKIDIVLQTDALARFDQMFAPHAAEIRVMKNQVREFGALLHQVDIGQAFHLVVKPVKADEFAEYDARVVEAKGLVKIAGQKILLHHGKYSFFLPATAGANRTGGSEASSQLHVNRNPGIGPKNNFDGCYARKT